MERKIVTKASYVASAGIQPVGVSKTVPRLSLSVSELVKRFTLTTLKEMEAKSLLTYDFGPEVTEDPFKLLEKVDLSSASCIDITDVVALRDFALSQIEEYKSKYKQEIDARAEVRKKKIDENRQSIIEEAKAQLRASGIKIE